MQLPASPITNASDAQLHCLNAPSSSPPNGALARACSCASLQLSFPPLPLLAAMDDSPPDSPTMPWRPGSSAYPPAPPTLTPADDSLLSCFQRSKVRDFQKLYNTLSEASYDLSLRDIVEPPYSIDGSLGACSLEPSSQGEAEPSPRQPLPTNSYETQKPCQPLKQQLQKRSISCRKFESSKQTSPKCKLAFSLSYPRRGMAYTCSSPSTVQAPIYNLHISPSPTHKASVKNSPSSSLEHVLAAPHDQEPALPSQRVSHATLSRQKHSFKRSSTDVHHSSSVLKLDTVHTERRVELNFRGTFSVTGSSSRVHPSSQCYSCSSYTIFFKSRCTVCGKLYCSNCAKDEMDSVSDGRRCKSSCNSRLSSRRFSTSMRRKCWPLCCNVDVLNNTSECRPESH